MKNKTRIIAAVLCVAVLISVCIIAVKAKEPLQQNPEITLVEYISQSLVEDVEKTGKDKKTLIVDKGAALGVSEERAVELGLTTGALLDMEVAEYIKKINYEIVNNEAVIKSFEEGIDVAVIPDEIAGYPINLRGDQTLKDSGIKQVVFCEGTKEIGYSAVSRCKNVESIVLPASLEGIRSDAFGRCTNLKNINIPLNVSRIGSSVFYGCTSLESIVLPSGIISCGDSLFGGCENLRSVSLPKGVITLGERAFSGCISLKEVLLPDTISCIGENCFYGCESLTSITLPKSLTIIENETFRGCIALEKVNFNTILEEIKDGAFGGCTALEQIILPENLKYLGRQAFAHCDNLKSIVIPSGITEIKDRTFNRCLALESVHIPSDVTKIGDLAFFLCQNLSDIYFEGTEQQWLEIEFGESVGFINDAEVHFQSDLIPQPSVPSSDPVGDDLPATEDIAQVTDDNGITYRIQGREASVIGYTGTPDEVRIPSKIGNALVTEIDKHAFIGCESLKVLHLSEGLKVIRPYAFGLCTNLSELSLPYSLEEISDFAFYSCSAVNKVTYAGDRQSWSEVEVGLSNDNVKNVRNFTYMSYFDNVYFDEIPVPAEPKEGHTRIYLYMHKDWCSVGGTSRPGIFWQDGDNAPENPWGYMGGFTQVKGIYYYDVPSDVTQISWNNLYNTSWFDKCRTETMTVNPDMENMILVLYKEKSSVDDDTAVFGGQWFYYYGNGEYGNTKNKEDADSILSASFVYAPDSTDPLATATGPIVSPFERGDVNTDSKVNIKDATAIQKYLAKLIKFDFTQKGLADANLDYKIDVRDVTYIQKLTAKLI